MLRLLSCDVCHNNVMSKGDKAHHCKAFPNGIPSGWLYFDKDIGQYCNNGYGYSTDECDEGVADNSLLSRMLDYI